MRRYGFTGKDTDSAAAIPGRVHPRYLLWAALCIAGFPAFMRPVCAMDEGDAIVSDPNALRDLVVQGILQNCRRLDCGMLTWHMEQKGRGSGDYVVSNEGSYRMWWDGDKVATEYTDRSTASDRPDTTEQQIRTAFNGTEYRTMNPVTGYMGLHKQVDAHPYTNFLHTIRWPVKWPGNGKSIIEDIEAACDSADDSTKWHLTEENGIRYIELMRTRKDGSRAIWYFDPSRGYMRVRNEGFDSGGELCYSEVWRFEQVAGGAWFPIECQQKGFPPKKAASPIEEFTTHIVVDLEQSSLNDRSAIPNDIFELPKTSAVRRIIDSRFGEPFMYDVDVEALAIDEAQMAVEAVPADKSPGSPEDSSGTHELSRDVVESPISNRPDTDENSPPILSQTSSAGTVRRVLSVAFICIGVVVSVFVISRLRRKQTVEEVSD